MSEFESPTAELAYKVRCGERLALARESLDRPYTVAEMATFLGVPYQTYKNWENGLAYVRRDRLKALKDAFGINFDWVGDGDPSGLREPMRSKILAHKGERPHLFNERS